MMPLKAHNAHRPLGLEPLEDRIAPAGVVTAVVSNGNLVVTGDESANDIVIDHAGLGPGEIRVTSGLDATSVNGGADAILAGFTGGIVLRMYGGDNHVLLDTVDVAKSITFKGGPGANHVEVAGGTIGGSLTLIDGMVVELAGVTVTGNANIRNAPGQCVTDVDSLVAHNLVIHSAATSESRVVNVTDSTLTGSLRLSNAGPGPTATYVSSTAMTMLRVANGSGDDIIVANAVICTSTGAAVSISNGVQDASTEISGSSNIAGRVTIGSAAWSDTVQILDSTVLRGVSVRNTFWNLFLGGLGVYVDNSTIGVDDAHGIYSGLRVSAGHCQTLVSLAGSEIGANVAAFFAGGAVYAENATIGGSFAAKSVGFADADVVMSATTVGGGTAIRTPYQDNSVTIDDCSFGGSVLILTSKGSDTVEIEANGLSDGPVSTFFGPVTIRTGDGDDVVVLAIAGQAGNHGVYSATLALDGGDGTDTLDAEAGSNTFATAPAPAGFEIMTM